MFEVELGPLRLPGQTLEAVSLQLDGVSATGASGSPVGVEVQVWWTATSRWVAVESTPSATHSWIVATTGETPILSPVARRARFRVLPMATIGTALAGPTLNVDRAAVSVMARW